MADAPPLAEQEDAYAWAVIACVAELLAPEVDAVGGDVVGGIRAAFELVEDALAERRQARTRTHGAVP